MLVVGYNASPPEAFLADIAGSAIALVGGPAGPVPAAPPGYLQLSRGMTSIGGLSSKASLP